MIAFLLSPLGLRLIAGLGVALILWGLVASHDAKVRKVEAAKWEPKLTQCANDRQTATDANAKLAAEYRAFVDSHNKQLAELAGRQADAFKARDKALAGIHAEIAGNRAAVERLRADAAGPAQPSKEVACEKADALLRALASELLRDDAARK